MRKNKKHFFITSVKSKAGQLTGSGPPAWGLVVGLTSPHCKNLACCKILHRGSELVGPCEYGNEPLGSIKDKKFLDLMSDY
jgi:hypothetical protein